MMDLRRYPLDEQNCTLEIESCKFKRKEIERTALSSSHLQYMSNTVILMKKFYAPHLMKTEPALTAESLAIYDAVVSL